MNFKNIDVRLMACSSIVVLSALLPSAYAGGDLSSDTIIDSANFKSLPISTDSKKIQNELKTYHLKLYPVNAPQTSTTFLYNC